MIFIITDPQYEWVWVGFYIVHILSSYINLHIGLTYRAYMTLSVVTYGTVWCGFTRHNIGEPTLYNHVLSLK